LEIFAVGGRGYPIGEYTDTTVVFDLSAGTWSEIAHFPTVVNWPFAAFVDGRLYAGAGTDANQVYLTTFAVLAQDQQSWGILPPLPFEAFRPEAVAYQDQLWVVGDDGVWVYDPATEAWAGEAIEFPAGSNSWRPVVVDGELYLMGDVSSTLTVVHWVA
jgi:hypothetical protein